MRNRPAVRMKKRKPKAREQRGYVSLLEKLKGLKRAPDTDANALFNQGKEQVALAYGHFKLGFRRLIIVVEMLVLLVLVVAAVAYWQNLRNNQHYHIDSIQMLGHQPEPVERALREKLAAYQSEGLFTADIKELSDDLATIPWVRSVTVMRSWPNALIVDVDTWEPVARWGENQWLDNTGQLFSLETALSSTVHLPQLNGPEEDAVQVYKMYQQVQKLFNQYGLQLAGINKLSSGSWQVDMQSGMKVKLKDGEVFEGLRGFVKIYDQIASQASLVDYVDMRYPDGGAIRWQPDPVAAMSRVAEDSVQIQ